MICFKNRLGRFHRVYWNLVILNTFGLRDVSFGDFSVVIRRIIHLQNSTLNLTWSSWLHDILFFLLSFHNDWRIQSLGCAWCVGSYCVIVVISQINIHRFLQCISSQIFNWERFSYQGLLIHDGTLLWIGNVWRILMINFAS